MVVGLAMLGGSGVNLMVFLAADGRVRCCRRSSPPAPNPWPAAAANPLPQALVLTAIVIGFALLCFGLVLAARLANMARSEDADALRATEPPGGEGDKPAVLEP
jgi:multicomponent Na+:H+ antiporter subunit C